MEIVAGSICITCVILFLGLHILFWKKRQKNFTTNKKEQNIFMLLKQNIWLMLSLFMIVAAVSIFISLI